MKMLLLFVLLLVGISWGQDSTNVSYYLKNSEIVSLKTINSLWKANFVKDQQNWESDSLYEARKEKTLSNKAYYVSVIPVTLESNYNHPSPLQYPMYNYDANTLKYNLLFQDPITLFYSETHTGNYIGTNAFGVEKNINKWTYCQYSLEIPYTDADYKLIGIPPRLIKQNILKVGIFFYVSSSTRLEDYRRTPTIDSPFDCRELNYIIPVVITKTILFNKITGEVYSVHYW